MANRRDPRGFLYEFFFLTLSVYVLVVLVAESFFVDDPETRRILQFIDFFICLLFLGDFVLNVAFAASKREYLKWGWIDFVSSIPAVDALRWGRLSRMVRIVRYLRAARSARFIFSSIKRSRLETLTATVFLIVFLAFSLSSAFVLEFERGYDSTIRTAEDALWWSFLNVMNAKTSIDQAASPEGVAATTILNKVGLLLFAYLNSLVIAWLLGQRDVAHSAEEAGAWHSADSPVVATAE